MIIDNNTTDSSRHCAHRALHFICCIRKGHIMNGLYYSMGDWNTSIPTNYQFPLHFHDQYEIFLFLEGDAKYIVEEKTYTLVPGDIIIIRKHEMHRVFHNSQARYQRCVLMVDPEFFRQHNCPDYEAQFLHAVPGTDNKIAAEIVRSSGLYDAFIRYRRYADDPDVTGDSPILISAIIEILYLINKITGFSTPDLTNSPIKDIILYLNNRFTDEITLDMLSEKFFLSKYYLCRSFRKATGLTVHEYICRKRLAVVRELRAEGRNLNDAAMMAGFRDYSCFYRAYVKEYGHSPSSDLP